jgi:hypothetical protein
MSLSFASDSKGRLSSGKAAGVFALAPVLLEKEFEMAARRDIASLAEDGRDGMGAVWVA